MPVPLGVASLHSKVSRYPPWKYIIVLAVLAIGFLYTPPSFFGEAPAMQVSSGKATVKVDLNVQKQVESLLAAVSIRPDGIFSDNNDTSASVRVRFADISMQLKAKDVLTRGLNTDQADPTYIVALDLLPGSPQWLSGAPFFAKSIFLGPDLRGGVHLLLQVDMNDAVTKRFDSLAGDIRTQLRDKGIRYSDIDRNNDMISTRLSNPDEAGRVHTPLADSAREPAYTVDKSADDVMFIGTFAVVAIKEVQNNTAKQNVVTLHNRVDELGVAEPVIQRQDPNRIVVQLPGIQDTAEAKGVIGRIAALEARPADPNAPLAPRPSDPVPLGGELFTQGRSIPVLLQKQVIFTGDRIASASVGFDQDHNSSADTTFDDQNGRMLCDASCDSIGRRMGIVFSEEGKSGVPTVATIQSELSLRFQTIGIGSTEAVSDLALLLRTDSLAVPMGVIEERTIGPLLSADNVKKGFDSALHGLLVISVFMVPYYMLLDVFSAAALGVNVFPLIVPLSMPQATLASPSIAAIALALGIATDASVPINEHVREELHSGASAQMIIAAGFDCVWATILDSNVMAPIVGLVLIIFGSGPVRGFAIVHCLGIGTFMFLAVFLSRGLVNLWYDRKKKLQSVTTGQVWRPGNTNTESPTK